jgi:hypothetical protein
MSTLDAGKGKTRNKPLVTIYAVFRESDPNEADVLEVTCYFEESSSGVSDKL